MIKPMSALTQEPDIRKQTIYVTTGEKNKWNMFSEHHYMSHTLPRSCQFFVFYIKKDNIFIPIGCLGMLLQINKKPSKRVTRFVILPEYQGLGFSSRILDGISWYYHKNFFLTYIVTFHPRLGTMLTNSKNWTPSTNNQKENNQPEREVNGQVCIRTNEKMYRFKYTPKTLPEVLITIDFLSGNSQERKQAFNDDIIEYTKLERIKYKRAQREERAKLKKEKELDSQMASSYKKPKTTNKRSAENLERLRQLKEKHAAK